MAPALIGPRMELLVAPLPPSSATSDARAAHGDRASLLPAPDTSVLPDLGDDMGAQIAALAVSMGQTERRIDDAAAATEDLVESNAEADQVRTMRDEASTMRTGAWESGLLQMGAGACTVASAAITLDAPSSGTSAGGDVVTPAGSRAASVASILKGGAEGLSSGATLAGGLNKAAETDQEALAAGQKALADSAARSANGSRDAGKAASDFIASAVAFYREYAATRAQAQAAALHGA